MITYSLYIVTVYSVKPFRQYNFQESRAKLKHKNKLEYTLFERVKIPGIYNLYVMK